MIAIVLCAGFGTRMYPLTRNRPKALLPVAGRPVIDYLIDQLQALPGLKAIHIASNDLFYGHFERWRTLAGPELSGRGIALRLHNNGVSSNENRLGAIGDLAFVLRRIELPAGALVAAGDNIIRFDLLPVWESFRASQVNTVIALAEDDPDRLRRTGVLELDRDNRVVGFFEKPNDPPSAWFCPPFYFLNRDALEWVGSLTAQRNTPDAMGYLIQHLVARAPVYAFKAKGSRLDIGGLDTYKEANEILEQGSAGHHAS